MKVIIQQPVIPAYRVPLFNALAKVSSIELEVHASQIIPGLPRSADMSLYKFNFVEHECITQFNGAIYKQKALKLPEDFGKGDVLVYNSNPRFISNRSLVNQAKSRGSRVIAWNHANSSTSSGLKSWLRKKLTASKADDLLLYTKEELSMMLGEGWKRENLYYLNNTIDEQAIFRNIISFSNEADIKNAKSSKAVLELKRERGFEDKQVFLFCGRLTEKSELNLLLKALSICSPEDRSNLIFIIIGDGGKRGDYEKLSEELGLSENFIWLGAIYEEKELTPLFLSADFFIYPGAIGLSLNHAMAYGLPVITHNLGSKQMPEFSYLRDGFNGKIFEFQSEQALSQLLIEFLEKPELSRQLSDGAFQTMHKNITFQKMILNFETCIREQNNRL